MSPKISEESKTQKKSYIIGNAMKLFSQKGFVETSMEDIVKATGMSKGGIYNYFKSKEEIFLAIAEDRFNKRHRLIENFEKSTTSTEKVKNYIQWILGGLFDEDTLLNARFTFEFWSVVSRNPETLVATKKICIIS
ncbi:TetR/AcrR family transcriptional regulator [Clostridium sp. OS1-26]|uniref:TetR/AcrR family transcriptional regulator n=1 Tax=Clostridium sp. OS1-26 TaxID=3070681 RepID=UPI0027E13FC3|nr:TetR/AcrR family transcriptional regulator [Clostridium sp. OS1-26]WML33711.1 TetR/AcrR family transcriptional regulator [Clostridium sp. OS1-26]